MGADGASWHVGSPVMSLHLGGTLQYLLVVILGRGDLRKYPFERVPTSSWGYDCGEKNKTDCVLKTIFNPTGKHMLKNVFHLDESSNILFVIDYLKLEKF
jgi:hypothetical protein